MNDDEYGGGKSGADEGDDGAGNVDDESITVKYLMVMMRVMMALDSGPLAAYNLFELLLLFFLLFRIAAALPATADVVLPLAVLLRLLLAPASARATVRLSLSPLSFH